MKIMTVEQSVQENAFIITNKEVSSKHESLSTLVAEEPRIPDTAEEQGTTASTEKASLSSDTCTEKDNTANSSSETDIIMEPNSEKSLQNVPRLSDTGSSHKVVGTDTKSLTCPCGHDFTETVKDFVKILICDMKSEVVNLLTTENDKIKNEVEQLREENTNLKLLNFVLDFVVLRSE